MRVTSNGSSPARTPVRTLHIEWNDDGTVGGSHQALFDLVTRLDDSRFQPVALFHQQNPFVARLEERGIETHDYGPIFRAERDLRLRSGLLRRRVDMVQGIQRRVQFLREQRIGLVHLNNSPDLGGTDWMPAARLLRIPVVSSVMAKGADEASLARRLMYRGFDRILPVSDVVAQRWMSIGVHPRQIRIIHHGVDHEVLRARVTRDKNDVRNELGVPDGRLLVLMAGNVRYWKGQHVVLSALSGLPEAVRDRLFVAFAGAVSANDHDYVRKLETAIRDGGLATTVRMLGFRNDLPNLMSASDIVVHASIEIEPGGITVLEAMALGRAVVAAAEGGHTEVMIPGTGLTFDTRRPEELGRCLAELSADHGIRERLGDAARRRVAEFGVDRNVEKTEAVYFELLGH